MENSELKKVCICTCCYFDDIIKIEDFDFVNTLLDEKSYENILVYTFHEKLRIAQNPCVLCSIK